MPRYKLTIAYDGTHFCGWQKQEPLLGNLVQSGQSLVDDAAAPVASTVRDPIHTPSSHTRVPPPVPVDMVAEHLDQREGEVGPRVALRTVQHVVERAARMVTRERVNLDGASRTDSGVHARGQVAAFTCGDGTDEERTGWPISRGLDRLVRAMNGKLPEDVVVLEAEVVPEDFDPVRHATSKAYSYTIHNSRERTMWDRQYVHCVHEPLDVAAMQRAASHLVGTHDFVAFAAANHGRLTTVRTVFACGVRAVPVDAQAQAWAAPRAVLGLAPEPLSQRVRIDITGSGFLYNMVRIISGTLVEVGLGRMDADAIPGIITGKDRRAAGPTLPGRGLCLEWIRYDSLGVGA